jgi:hypothetical protein
MNILGFDEESLKLLNDIFLQLREPMPIVIIILISEIFSTPLLLSMDILKFLRLSNDPTI